MLAGELEAAITHTHTHKHTHAHTHTHTPQMRPTQNQKRHTDSVFFHFLCSFFFFLASVSPGDADIMLVGGSEAAITPLSFAGFPSMKAMCTTFIDNPTEGSRPFDADRCGFVMGEVCNTVLQCIAVYCSVLQCIAVYCSVLQRVAVCCSVLQCIAVYCNVSQCVAVYCGILQCIAVYCSVLQCVAVYRSVLQCVAVRCSVLQPPF